MEVVRCWEEDGVTIDEPFKRHIKVFLAPDRREVRELTYSHALIYPKSRTDYHSHDRSELIQILSGRGIAVCDEAEVAIQADMALWVRPGEMHQIINTGEESMKLATVFVPAFTAAENFKRCTDAAGKGQEPASS
jgi:mannose-6-phosphate isomerase-like protein (cupin superfamily)